VSHGLAKMCRADIKEYKCRHEQLSKRREVRLAQILLCLEEAINDGRPVSGPCQAEMLEHRKALLDPLGLSPELIVDCEDDIHRVCMKDQRYRGRPTLECLMDLAAASKHELVFLSAVFF
jgi:Golgi apparatus protein 1